MILTLIAIIVFCTWWWLKHQSKQNHEQWLDAENVPEIIKNSKTWAKEELFLSHECGIMAKPDVVFKNKELFIGELKTRKFNKYYRSDVIQMSVGRVVLESNGNKVSDKGYIKIATPNGSSWHEVSLYNRNEVIQLFDKYNALKTGASVGERCGVKKICESCEYNDVC